MTSPHRRTWGSPQTPQRLSQSLCNKQGHPESRQLNQNRCWGLLPRSPEPRGVAGQSPDWILLENKARRWSGVLTKYTGGPIPRRYSWAATGREGRHGERTGVTWGQLLLEKAGHLAHWHTSLLRKRGRGSTGAGGLYPSALRLLLPTGQGWSSGSYLLTPVDPVLCPLVDSRKPGPRPSRVAWFSDLKLGRCGGLNGGLTRFAHPAP